LTKEEGKATKKEEAGHRQLLPDANYLAFVELDVSV
jgi:hypothetical protein